MMRLVVLATLLVPVTAAAEPQVSPYLYLNRCSGGCTVHSGFDDARAMTSSIPNIAESAIAEFENSAGEIGTAADAEWAELVKCVREVYSPYNIMVTDTLPPGGLSHNQGIVAGSPSQIGWSGIGGVAPGGCTPRDNVISFTFSNIYGGTGSYRIYEICATVAQETAHAYGLDHAYSFLDGRSACPDPMSYRSDCGGQRFFRNDNATCGEFSGRPCSCGGFQNSHLKILAIFGAGTPITRPPTLTVSTPQPGDQIASGATVVATAAAQRGVFRLELWLNNYKWLTVKGAPFGSSGQLETAYPMTLPAAVPDGVIDIVVKAFDDINVETDSPTITVTKGAPCTSAASCAKGQKCETGRCFWDPPTGQVGQACDYPQFCETGNCLDTTSGMFCTQDCVVGVSDSCPINFVCEGQAGGTGFCVSQTQDTSCCSVGTDGRPVALLALGVLVLLRRRRR